MRRASEERARTRRDQATEEGARPKWRETRGGKDGRLSEYQYWAAVKVHFYSAFLFLKLRFAPPPPPCSSPFFPSPEYNGILRFLLLFLFSFFLFRSTYTLLIFKDNGALDIVLFGYSPHRFFRAARTTSIGIFPLVSAFYPDFSYIF